MKSLKKRKCKLAETGHRGKKLHSGKAFFSTYVTKDVVLLEATFSLPTEEYEHAVYHICLVQL